MIRQALVAALLVLIGGYYAFKISAATNLALYREIKDKKYQDEAINDRAALKGVADLGMKLQTVESSSVVKDASDGGARCARHHSKPTRCTGHLITVTHPYIEPFAIRLLAVGKPS